MAPTNRAPGTGSKSRLLETRNRVYATNKSQLVNQLRNCGCATQPSRFNPAEQTDWSLISHPICLLLSSFSAPPDLFQIYCFRGSNARVTICHPPNKHSTSPLNLPRFGPPAALAHHRPVRSLRESNRYNHVHHATRDAGLHRDSRRHGLPRPRLLLRPMVQIDLLPKSHHAAGQLLWCSHLWRTGLLL